MTDQKLETTMFGRPVSFEYSSVWVGYSLFILRLMMGWTFFYAGITKVIDPRWTVKGYLLHAIPAGNPFTGFWTMLANDWAWLMTPLNQVGLTLIGLALLFGVLFRFSAFWGGVMMTFYWAASYPFSNHILVDYHLVYVFLLFGLGAFGAGRILGLDSWIESWSIVEDNPRLKLLLG
jgi:thiosulfate dehydrogenase [quinone] large subunit